MVWVLLKRRIRRIQIMIVITIWILFSTICGCNVHWMIVRLISTKFHWMVVRPMQINLTIQSMHLPLGVKWNWFPFMKSHFWSHWSTRVSLMKGVVVAGDAVDLLSTLVVSHPGFAILGQQPVYIRTGRPAGWPRKESRLPQWSTSEESSSSEVHHSDSSSSS